MKKYGPKLAKCLLFLLPYSLGAVGFSMVEDKTALDALFNSLQLYTLNYGETPPNLLIEVARWTAPLATLSGIMALFRSLKTKLVQRLRYLRGKSVAVYGCEEDKRILLQQLGTRGIDGGRDFVPADRYILMGSEEENLSFYSRYREKLDGRQVYLKNDQTHVNSLAVSDLHPFRVEELAARLFWKERFLYPQFRENGGTLELVLLGFGNLGEDLLTFGLQNLVYSPEQEIRWHVFGDGEKFEALHPQLDRIGDRVRFYREPWYRDRVLLERADLVLVVQQEDQNNLLEALLGVLTRREIDVFTKNADAVRLLNEEGRLRVFDWKRKTQKVAYILGDELLDRAKQINLRYAHLFRQVEENEESREREWDRLNTFTRYSNISAADYHDVRLQMLRAEGITPRDALADAETLDRLACLEHIRWCRYHYLNNWSYGRPDNGKSKDPVHRIHADLVPYEDLMESEKEKDRENVRVLFSI